MSPDLSALIPFATTILQSAQPVHDDGPVTPFAIPIAFQAVTIVVVCARLFTRIFLTQKAGVDDWLILAAGLISIAFTVFLGLSWNAGAGRHAQFLTEKQLVRVGQTAWISSMLTAIACMLVRCSLLVFFLRLFPSRGVRIISIIQILASVAFGLGTFFAQVFECVPIGAHASQVQHCINFPLFFRLSTVISMVLDFAILLTPIPSLYNAMMPWRARLSIILVFAIGFVPCIASAVRVDLVGRIAAVDYTRLMAVQLTWAAAELQMAIICACVAGLKPLFARYVPKLIGSSWLTSDNNNQHTSGPTASGRLTGMFAKAGQSRGNTVELRNLGAGSTNGNGEVFSIQITKSTITRAYADGGGSVLDVVKEDVDDTSQHEREMKR